MAAINDYSDLLAQVAEYTGRDDFAYMFPRFVSYAEAKLNRQLRIADQETTVSLTTDASGAVALPANYQEARIVYDARGIELKLATPASMLSRYGITGGGTPSFYTISGRSLKTAPPAATTITMVYYAALPPLVAGGSNWLLLKYPTVYLYAVSAELYGWLAATNRDAAAPTKASSTQQMLSEEIGNIIADDTASRWSNSQVVIGGITP